jgi:hypothetical protein
VVIADELQGSGDGFDQVGLADVAHLGVLKVHEKPG